MKTKPKLYLDTSVFGGYFDKEFKEDSRKLIDGVVRGDATIVISEIVLLEIDNKSTPIAVRELVYLIPNEYVEFILINDQVQKLASEYLAKNVVPKKSTADAAHVALATLSSADAIISWNFKHIVRLDRIQGFNKVNESLGFPNIFILSPKEVVL